MRHGIDIVKLLGSVRWGHETDDLLIELQELLYAVLRRRSSISDADMLEIWRIIAEKNSPVAILMMDKLLAEDLLDDPASVTAIISEAFEVQDPEKADLFAAQHLATAVMLGKDAPKLKGLFRRVRNKDAITLCTRALEYIEATYDQGDREQRVLDYIDYIYRSGYLNTGAIRTLIYERYHFLLMPGVTEKLNDLICRLIRDGSFDLAQNVKNMFSYYDYSMTGMDTDEMFDLLEKTTSKEFFRGCLIYRDFVGAMESLDALKKWYSDVSSIESAAARSNLVYLKEVYMLYALELRPDRPEEVLAELGIDYREKLESESNRNHVHSHYRRACYVMLLAGRVDFVISFLRSTGYMNPDRYYRRALVSEKIVDHIGRYDQDELLAHLMNGSEDMEDIIYIYFNSFLRSSIRITRFMYKLKEKFQLSIRGLSNAFRNYRLECIFNNKKGRDMCTDDDKIMVIPSAVRSTWYDIITIPRSQRELLRSFGYDEDYSLVSFTTAIDYAKPEENSGVIFLSVAWDEYPEKVLSGLRNTISDYKAGNISMNDLTWVLGSVNANMLYKNEEFIELCIDILDLLVDVLRKDTRRCRRLVELFNPNNLFNYHPFNRSSFARKIDCVSDEQERRIRGYWDMLADANAGGEKPCDDWMFLEMIRLVFQNTILRRFFTLEDFLQTFVNEKDRKWYYSRKSISEMTGKIAGSRFDQDKGQLVIDIEPVSFITGSNSFRAYVPAGGTDGSGYTKGGLVKFKITSYEGNGRFIADELEQL